MILQSAFFDPNSPNAPRRNWPIAAALATMIGLATVAAPAAGQDGAAAAQRVVSLSVCADQLLVALAEPGQIASLSSNVTDGKISYYADIADRFSHGAGGAEAVIGYAPDVVLVDAGTELAARDELEGLGYRFVEIAAIASIDEAIVQVREVAALLGREQEGEALATIIDSARRQATRTNWGDTAISFRRGGFVPGHGTLMSDLLGVIGLNNVGEALSGGDGRVPLEVLVASPPDYLVVPEEEPGAGGQSLALLAHPALIDIYPPARRILLPDRLTYCGGPSIPEALRWLASELDRVTP
jgi:iron complex transport system substrate-binding protein